MNINRRRFCSAALFGSSTIAIGSVSAQPSIPVNLDVRTEAEADISGVELYLSNVDTNDGPTVELPSNGQTEVTLPEPGTYRVTAFDRLDPTADIPLIYEFDNISVDENNTDFTFSIPEAYETQIKLVDTDGDPIEDLSVNLRSMNGTTGFQNDFVTNEEGYMKYIPEEKTSIELTGQIRVELQSGTRLDTLDVTESTEFEVTVPEQRDTIPLASGDAELIEPDESTEFNFPYVLYKPDLSEETTIPLCVRPHNSAPVRTTRELNDQLIGENSPVYSSLFSIATENQYPGIIPGFPRTPDDGPDVIQTLALPSYRSDLLSERYHLDSIATDDFSAQSLERVDKQLLAIISDAKDRLAPEPYSVAEQVHMGGFSAGATFCNRFAFLYPDKVRTITTGGSVVLPLPTSSYDDITLGYPLGADDYESIVGREFDMESWKNINRYIFLGEEDRPEPGSTSQWYGSLRYEDAVSDVHGDRRVTERFPFIRSQYNAVAPDTSEFELFSGVGHEISPEMEEAAVSNITRGTGSDSGSPEADIKVTNVELNPDTVDSDTTNEHTLTFDVSNVSADGEDDVLTLTFPDGTLVSTESISAVDADGDSVAFETGTIEGDTRTVTFNPFPIDGDRTPRDITVTVENATVAAPNVTNTTDVSIQIDWEDSANGQASANATLTVIGTDSESSPITNYANEQGVVDTAGLLQAITDWRNDELDTAVLLETINVWRSGESVA